jgi:hypothetical protein
MGDRAARTILIVITGLLFISLLLGALVNEWFFVVSGILLGCVSVFASVYFSAKR